MGLGRKWIAINGLPNSVVSAMGAVTGNDVRRSN